MTHFKTILMTAAVLALPSAALAQISTDALTGKVKDKAVDAIIENATKDDALTAGKVLLKGGSKEDAAIAIVKDRANDKVEGIVGDQTGGVVSTDGLSKDNMVAAGKDKLGSLASDKVQASTSGAALGSGTVYDSAKGAVDTAKGSATTYTDQPAPSQPNLSQPNLSAPTPAAPTLAAPAVNCPAGTTATDAGTCMITGDYRG